MQLANPDWSDWIDSKTNVTKRNGVSEAHCQLVLIRLILAAEYVGFEGGVIADADADAGVDFGPTLVQNWRDF
jgi:hypothetical protein